MLLENISLLFSASILFFVFGMLAGAFRVNLEFPDAIAKFIIIYLMIAIGIKGGQGLYESTFSLQLAGIIAAVFAVSYVIPKYVLHLLEWRGYDRSNAAAIAGTYGSNSTMTFITAAAFLASINIEYSAYMLVALVVMETPAIIYAIYSARKQAGDLVASLKQSLGDGTHLLLIASLAIGFLTSVLSGDSDKLTGFISGDLFSGIMCIFLLYMGLRVGSELRNLSHFPVDLSVFALIAPFVNAGFGALLAAAIGLGAADAFLFIVLAASASYIVAPAIYTQAIPEASTSWYLGMSLGITFPVNIIIGLPLYWQLAQLVG